MLCLQVPVLGAQRLRGRLPGLVYEAEEWSGPKDAWRGNEDTPDRWNLRTDDDARKKHSREACLWSPVLKGDRDSPGEGAPPLHTRITGIPAGTYCIYLNHPQQAIAYSYDGEKWLRGEPVGEIALGAFDIRDGTFELWVDDRFTVSSKMGPCCYDYVRLEPCSSPTLSSFEAYRLSDGRVQVSWVSDRPVDTGILEGEAGGRFVRMAESPARALRNHRVWVKGWQPGQLVRVRARFPMGPCSVFTSEPVELRVPPEPPSRAPLARRIPLKTATSPLPGRPVLAGLPLPPGELWQTRNTWVEDAGRLVPSQVTEAARWPDGSVKWLLVRFLPKAESQAFELVLDSARPMTENPFQVERTAAGLRLTNGRLRFRVSRKRFALFDQVQVGGSEFRTGEPVFGNVRIVDGAGDVWGLGPPQRLEVEEEGPVRAVVRIEGPFENTSGLRRFRYRLRYFLTAFSPLVRIQLTLLNDVMRPVFTPLKSLDVRIPLAGDGPLRAWLASGEPADVAEPQACQLQQVTDKRLRITRSGRTTEQELRCLGWAVAERGPARVALAVRNFWQSWPKGLAAKPDGLHIRLLPRLAPDEYQARDINEWAQHLFWFRQGRYLFKRGMAIRAEFWVRFDSTGEPLPQGDWATWAQALHAFPYAVAPSTLYCDSGAFGPVLPARPDEFPEYEVMVERGVRQFLSRREEGALYGWMNFGDWYGDRTFNWANNEYDWSWAMALQFARTGRWEYLQAGEATAAHCSTVDTIHFSFPCSPQMPGRVWAHSVGHVGAGMEPNEVGLTDERWDAWIERNRWFFEGAIEPGGHIHREGSFAYYFLTGDRDYLEAAELAAGAQAAYKTANFDFGIARGAGWPLSNAVAAYEATDNPFYLNAARLYVERILQKQDPDSGGWLQPQPASASSDGLPHQSGKPFATAVLLYAMMRYDLVEPRTDVQHAIVRGSEWLVTQGWDPRKQGFRYLTGIPGYPDRTSPGAFVELCSAGLAYAWILTGDPRFGEVLRVGFARMCEHTIGFPRHSPYALPVLRRLEPCAPDHSTRRRSK